MSKIILSFIVFLFSFPAVCFAEEPIPHDSFIEITESIIDKFDAMEEEAKGYDFNQLENPRVEKKFDDITAAFKKYKRYTSLDIKNWPEGRQKQIGSKLHLVNFLYMAYSITRDSSSRNEAEESLRKVRELFREYIRHANKK